MRYFLPVILSLSIWTTSEAQLPIEYLDSIKTYMLDGNGSESLVSYTIFHYDELYRDTLYETFEQGILTAYTKRWYDGNTTFEHIFELNEFSNFDDYLTSVTFDDEGRFINRTNYSTTVTPPIPSSKVDVIYIGDLIDMEAYYTLSGNALVLESYTSYMYDSNNRLEMKFNDHIEFNLDSWCLYDYDTDGNLLSEQVDRQDFSSGERYTWRTTDYQYPTMDSTYSTEVAYSFSSGDTTRVTLDTIVTLSQDKRQVTSVRYQNGQPLTKRNFTAYPQGPSISFAASNFDTNIQQFVLSSGFENVYDETISSADIAAQYLPIGFPLAPYKCLESKSYDANNELEEYRQTSRTIYLYKPVTTSSTREELLVFSMYPNPTADLITIDGAPLGSRYVVTDSNGRHSISGSLDGSPIDISALSTGCYMLTVSNSNSVSTQKFIKIR